jgi:hypothetical protein
MYLNRLFGSFIKHIVCFISVTLQLRVIMMTLLLTDDMLEIGFVVTSLGETYN